MATDVSMVAFLVTFLVVGILIVGVLAVSLYLYKSGVMSSSPITDPNQLRTLASETFTNESGYIALEPMTDETTRYARNVVLVTFFVLAALVMFLFTLLSTIRW